MNTLSGAPPLAPGVADPLLGVQDHERPLPPGQVVSRQTGLTAADDHGFEALGGADARHGALPLLGPARGSAGTCLRTYGWLTRPHRGTTQLSPAHGLAR